MKPDSKLKNGKNGRFNGDIREVSINTLIDYIRFSCILHLKKEDDEAAIYFHDGKVKGARLNKRTDPEVLEEIRLWKSGTFSFCEWNEFNETEVKYLYDILFLADHIKSSCKLKLSLIAHTGEIHVSEGKIVHAFFNDQTGMEAFDSFTKLKDGVFTMSNSNDLKNGLNLSFLEYKEKLIITISNSTIMNIKKLNASMTALQEDLGDALIASVIWTSIDGQSIASFNPQPKAAALFNTVSKTITKTLTDSGFPGLNDYYLLDLTEGTMILIIIFKDHQWGMLVNSSKIQLGLLLNVVMPKSRDSFKDALNT